MSKAIINAQKRRKRSNVKYFIKEQQYIDNLSTSEREDFELFIIRMLSKDRIIEGEKWIGVVNWDSYMISSYCRVMNITTGKIKTPHLHHSGYYTISMHKNGKPKYFILSRLIGLHFVPNPDRLPEINHKNKIRRDNRISNIEWNLSIENIEHRMTSLDYDNKKPIIQMDMDGNEIREWESTYKAAKTLSVSSGNITNTLLGKFKYAYGYKWKYKTV